MPRKTYRIITMGCQMNERDSETIAGLLEQSGYARMDAEDADIVVVNTCSVRENADNRFFGLLGRVKHIKERNPSAIVAVCGCMMQQAHIVDKISNNYSWVDIVFGTHSISDLPELLEELRKQRNAKPAPLISVPEGRGPGDSEEFMPAKRRDPHRAFVNIMYGCDNFCTYCIVPYVRGREVSRSPGRIRAEIALLAEKGVREVPLLGQNVNSYAYTGPEGALDFPGLLRLLAGWVRGTPIEWVRFLSANPRNFSGETIAVMAEHPCFCRHIHLPLQHGSSRVLGLMNRGYTREGYLDLVRRLREAMPGLSLSTDILVGFPGETDADLEETLTLMEEVKFLYSYMYHYNPREGTAAFALPDRVPEEVKRRRLGRVIELQKRHTRELLESRLGTETVALVEGISRKHADEVIARTERDEMVVFPGSPREVGRFRRVRLESLEGNTFRARGSAPAEDENGCV